MAEARALVRAIPDDPVELIDPLRLINVRRLGHRMRRALRAGRTAHALPALTATVLILQVGYAVASFGPPLLDRLRHQTGQPPGPLPLSLGLTSSLACGALVVVGLNRLRQDRTAAYRWFHRALLVNLLFTRVFEFDVEQFLAALSVLVDVVLLAVVTGAIAQHRAATTPPEPPSARRPDPAGIGPAQTW